MIVSNNSNGIITLDPITSADGWFAVHTNYYLPDVTTAANLWESTQEMGNALPQGASLWIQDGKLRVLRWATTIMGGTHGQWECDITVGYKSIQVVFLCNEDEAQNPVVYVNGVAQTMTETVTPVNQFTNVNVPMYFSFIGNARLMVNPTVALSDMAIWTRELTAQECAYLGSGLKRIANAIPDCIAAWDCDVEPTHSTDTGVVTGGSITIVPDSNISFTWTGAGTGYADVDADDGAYIQASKDDDGLECNFMCSSPGTLLSGHYIYGVEINMKLGCAVVSVYPQACPGYFYDAFNNGNYGYKNFQPSGLGLQTVTQRWWFGTATKLGQNAVDDMNVLIKAAAVINQDEEMSVYYLPLKLYGGHFIPPYVGTIGAGALGGVSFSNQYFKPK